MRLIRRAISNSKKSLYLVAGCDSNTPRLSPSPSHFWGNLCVGCMKTNQVAECPQLPQSFQKIDNEFISAISGIISATSGGYAEIYKTSPKYLGSINFPMPIPKDFTGFLKCGERSFLHGINRYYYKGSDKIIPALERMQKKWE